MKKRYFTPLIVVLLFIQAVAAHSKDLQIKTERQGSLSGTLYSERLQYWLKSGNSIYGIWMDDNNKQQDDWLSENVGKKITISGKIQEYKDGNLMIAPEPAVQLATQQPAISIINKSVFFGGKPIFNDPDAMSLSIDKKVTLANGTDLYLASINSGGTACPATYRIFAVAGGSCTVTDEFGNCSDLPTVSSKRDAATISFPRFGSGKGLTESWIFKDGKLMKSK